MENAEKKTNKTSWLDIKPAIEHPYVSNKEHQDELLEIAIKRIKARSFSTIQPQPDEMEFCL